MLIAISAPASNAKGAAYVEQVLRSLHEARVPLTLVFGQAGQTVGLFCRFHDCDEQTVCSQLNAHYSDCTIEVIPDDALDPHQDDLVSYADLRLRPDFYPLRVYAEYDDRLNHNSADPLTGILAALPGERDTALRSRIDVSIRPASWLRRRRAAWRAARLDYDQAQRKMARHLFATHIRLFVFASPEGASAARVKLYDLAAALGQFTVRQQSRFQMSWFPRHRYRRPRLFARRFLLSDEELSTLWHPATNTVRAPRMETTGSRQLEPPAGLPFKKREPELAVLGRVHFRDQDDVFGIRPEDRFRHLAVIGKTGMGKSTLLLNLVTSDIEQGRGIALFDPHGDLADAILHRVPARRTNDVVLFDASDREFPIAFNPLSFERPEQRPLVASGLVAVFKKLYGDSWGPRLEHILRHSLLALLEQPGVSLLSLLRLLSDARYRDTVTAGVTDPVVREFWTKEFAGWNARYRSEAIAPIQNKVGQFLSIPIVRAIVGQSRSTLDLRTVIDEGRILVVNLSKGKIGEDASSLLGSLLVTGLQLAAMSQANIREEDRQPFFAYVDEFQNFATESFATVLSEARKYRLALTIANQYLDQIDEATLSAVFGNVGSLLAFNVGPGDAEVLSEQLSGDVLPADLIALPKYTAYARLLIDGEPSRPFSMRTLPPDEGVLDAERSAIIRRTSRRRYNRPAAQVDREIEGVFLHA